MGQRGCFAVLALIISVLEGEGNSAFVVRLHRNAKALNPSEPLEIEILVPGASTRSVCAKAAAIQQLKLAEKLRYWNFLGAATTNAGC